MAQDNVNRRGVTSCYVPFRPTLVNCPLILQPPVNSSSLSFLTLRPPHGQKDHLARVVTSFKWIARRDWHRSTVSAGGAQVRNGTRRSPRSFAGDILCC